MSRKVTETALSNLAIQGLSAVTGILLARLLGPNGRGDLATALLWPSILGGIAVFGTDVALARLAASGGHRLRQIYNSLTIVVVLVSVPAALIGYFALPELFPEAKAALVQVSRFLLLAIPASVATVLCASVALGMGAHRLFNGIRLSYNIVYMAAVMAFALVADSTVFSTSVCFVLAAFCTAIYGLVSMRAMMNTEVGPQVGMSEIFSAAAPFGLVTVMQALLANLPVLLLSFLVDSALVGYFVVAMVAGGIHTSLGSAIGRMLFSKVCVGNNDVDVWVAAVFRQSLILYVLLAIILIVLLPYVVPIVFGEEFRYSGILAIGLVVSTSINALNSLLEETLRAKGFARQILLAQIAGAASLVLVAALLVPSSGLKGMVWAVVAGAIAQSGVIIQSVTWKLGIAKSDLIFVTRTDTHNLISRLRAALVKS